MNKAKLIPLFFCALSFGVQAQDLTSRIDSTHQRQVKAGQINCIAPNLEHLESEYIQNSHIKTAMKIADFKFSVKVDTTLRATLSSDKLEIPASIDKSNNIHFEFEKLTPSQLAISQQYNLDKMDCKAEYKKDIRLVLNTSRVHISVHPHASYDLKGFTTSGVNNYLMDKSYESVVLLDKLRDKQNLSNYLAFTGIKQRPGAFTDPVADISQDVPLYVSPAGHNFFDIKSNDLDVVYTGGNINFCIYNNTIQLIKSFVQTSTGGNLNINYDLNAIVAQNTSAFGSRKHNFSNKFWGLKNSRIVKDRFNKDPKFASTFTSGHRDAVAEQSIDKMLNFFERLVYTYEYNGEVKTKELFGSGSGTYEINIVYTNL